MTTYVNEERTVLVVVLSDGLMSVATREHPDAIWSPPTVVRREVSS